jgi:hypothetical protein
VTGAGIEALKLALADKLNSLRSRETSEEAS